MGTVALYVDASALLRRVLGQPGAVVPLRDYPSKISSALIEVEACRALDRLRWTHELSEEELVGAREAIYHALDSLELIEVTPTILQRAAAPLPTPLRTIDAIHLATLLTWRDASDSEVALATHDRRFAVAGRAFGLRVVGD